MNSLLCTRHQMFRRNFNLRGRVIISPLQGQLSTSTLSRHNRMFKHSTRLTNMRSSTTLFTRIFTRRINRLLRVLFNAIIQVILLFKVLHRMIMRSVPSLMGHYNSRSTSSIRQRVNLQPTNFTFSLNSRTTRKTTLFKHRHRYKIFSRFRRRQRRIFSISISTTRRIKQCNSSINLRVLLQVCLRSVFQNRSRRQVLLRPRFVRIRQCKNLPFNTSSSCRNISTTQRPRSLRLKITTNHGTFTRRTLALFTNRICGFNRHG